MPPRPKSSLIWNWPPKSRFRARSSSSGMGGRGASSETRVPPQLGHTTASPGMLWAWQREQVMARGLGRQDVRVRRVQEVARVPVDVPTESHPRAAAVALITPAGSPVVAGVEEDGDGESHSHGRAPRCEHSGPTAEIGGPVEGYIGCLHLD